MHEIIANTNCLKNIGAFHLGNSQSSRISKTKKKLRTDMNINHPKENKQGYLLRACYSRGVSPHHLYLATAPRQAENWERF